MGRQLIDEISNEIARLDDERRRLHIRYRAAVAQYGLEYISLKVGDIVEAESGGRRYVVTGAKLDYGKVVPTGVMLKADGSPGLRPMPAVLWRKVGSA